ncbi:MAG: hypothetical protein IPN31_02300 [Bacteroidetes bacterium]|nr:hypothetical protein [Bacteroidota bacterium]MBK8680740.1 hypothetical protein [Bacteroidota bacterium]
MQTQRKYFAILAVIISLLFGCKEKTQEINTLGIAHLEVSGNTSAQPYFEKGLLLLYSFEYTDARDEFIKAQEADPNMLMAYWGEAMTYNHTLWAEQDFEKATTAIKKITDANTLETLSSLEQDFIHSITLLYQTEKTKAERDNAYSNYLAEMYNSYPKNQEVAAFYALSILGTEQEGRDAIVYEKGAVIAQKILDVNPNHPGALHYLIHSYDDPEHAHLALDAANKYAKVAPDAAHALHMPSHIYVAMGMWDEVISSNEHSYQASVDRMERKQSDNDARGYHSYHWLEYGYLQKGREADAEKLVWDMQTYTNATTSQRSKTHLVYLKGTYLVETNNWSSAVADIPIDVSDLNVAVRAQNSFIEGMKAFSKKDNIALDKVIADLHADYEKESLQVQDVMDAHCASLDGNAVTSTNILQCKIIEAQLLGLSAWLENDIALTEEWFKKSITLEESISYSYGPPEIQKPTYELYGDWLLTQNRGEDAILQYELALKKGPNRKLALQGKQDAEKIIDFLN